MPQIVMGRELADEIEEEALHVSKTPLGTRRS
jgi:hypothetical protein